MYIVGGYGLMLLACLNEIIGNAENVWTFSWYVSLDTLIVSTYVTILMLILMFRHCPCCSSSQEDYNKIAVENSNSVLPDDSMNMSA